MLKNTNKFIIIGSGGHCRAVIDTINDLGHSIHGILDLNFNKKKDERILNHPIIGGLDFLNNIGINDFFIVLAVGDYKKRKDLFQRLISRNFKLVNIIHPTSIVSKKARIGRGVFINCGAIINADSNIGDNVLINTGSIIEHEVKISSHSNIGPGVNIGGRVAIGESAYIGIGSTIIHSLSVGENSIIGAGSVIISNVKKGTTVYGVPGKEKL